MYIYLGDDVHTCVYLTNDRFTYVCSYRVKCIYLLIYRKKSDMTIKHNSYLICHILL